MTEYKASNGITVDSETQGITGRRRITFDHGNHGTTIEMSGEEMSALIECLDQEKDESFGRWRPDRPSDYYAIPQGDGGVLVVDERSGISEVLYRPGDDRSPRLATAGGAATAHAYFEAHPERKPWDTASAGELWAFKTDPGTRETLWERDASESHWHLPGQTKAELGIHFTIVTGRKIWPEDAS